MPPLIELRDISKAFNGNPALTTVSLCFETGSIHAIVGENGAGKSTLMKILSGALASDTGQILIDGQFVNMTSPADAIRYGIAIVYQDLPLAPALSVLANVCLGRESQTRSGLIDEKRLLQRYDHLCDRVGLRVDPHIRVRDLNVGERQLVEILKCLEREARIVILDEPTASLDEDSKQRLFETIRKLRDRGTTFIFISHFLQDVFALADRISILRDSRHIATLNTNETTPEQVIDCMVGHTIDETRSGRASANGQVRLSVHGLSVPKMLHDITFELRAGEIVGLAGIVGSGRTSLAHALVGYLPISQGTVLLDSSPVRLTSPRAALKAGLCLLPGDRKVLGLLMRLPVYRNMSLSVLARFSPAFLIQELPERVHANTYIERLNIRLASEQQRAGELSGGNQQKTVLARMLATRAQVLILDEPTQGIDVGAKEEIFASVLELAAQGKSILFISSEFKELARICDRCLVIREGRIVAEYIGSAISEQKLLRSVLIPH